MKKPPALKQFITDGAVSYLVYDTLTRLALLVDPHLHAFDDYRTFMLERGIKPVSVLDTQHHSDRYSATHLFKSQFNSLIFMGDHTKCKRADRKLRGGDTVILGEYRFEVLETPGVADDAVCLLGEGMLFSGQTLLIGTSGRTGHPGSDPRTLWTSLKKLADLPGDTLLLPSLETNGVLFSQLRVEMKKNRDLRFHDGDEFVERKTSEGFAHRDADSKRKFDFNMSLVPAFVGEVPRDFSRMKDSLETTAFASINVEKYREKLRTPAPKQLFIDVRDSDEFVLGHIPGTTNVPLAELPFHLKEFQGASRVYTNCLSGLRSTAAARTLTYLGLMDVVNVTGGLKAWQNAGFEIIK